MAANRENGRNSPTDNGTEQQQTDLFQNLEKLIASAVSICRLDGSVQCQIGGLITVIEELQRLLRHSFAEIKRLERNLDDQTHSFTNNITNLHYQVKEVHSNVENLKHQCDEAQIARERNVDDPPQVSLVDESYGYGEESDGSIPNNLVNVDNTDRIDFAFAGLTQANEQSTSQDNVEDSSEKDAPKDRIPSPPRETTNGDASNGLNETATSTREERESALRILRSNSSKSGDSSDQEKPRRNHRLKNTARSLRVEAKSSRSILSSRKSRLKRGPLVISNPGKSPNTSSRNTKIFRKGTPPKTSLSKHVLNRNAFKSKGNSSSKPSGKIQRSPQKQITPKLSRKNIVSSSKVKKSPVKTAVNVSTRKSGKGEHGGIKGSGGGVKNNAKLSPLKLRNVERLSSKSSVIPSTVKQGKVVSNAKTNKATANESLSKESTTKESATPSEEASTRKVIPLEEKPIDKYINLDFLLNANQLMSELVADSDREEGTLDTASEVERRNIVDLAKLYRLRVRMAGKFEGELPVALIKGRESSLPKTGQVDKLLYRMTHAMAIKQSIKQSKDQANKHKLDQTARRQSAAGPVAKKRRV